MNINPINKFYLKLGKILRINVSFQIIVLVLSILNDTFAHDY